MIKQWLFVRTKYLIPISDKIGRNKRIQDGYILLDSSKNRIHEVGSYTSAKGNEIIQKYGSNLYILGNDTAKSPTETDLVQINGIALPGFVKAHGHDHESPIIGVAKDTPLTEWLDSAVNMFTGFMKENFDELTKKFGNPYLLTYLKARLDDISFGITTSVAHHCNFNKYRVAEIVEANKRAGTKLFVAVGSQDRNYDSRILDTPEEAIKRMEDAYNKYKSVPYTYIIPGPDQDFSNGPEMLIQLKKWANEHHTLLHIHSSEEPNTTKWFKEKYGVTPVQYFDSIKLLDGNTFVAHQVNCSPEDLEILARTKTPIVHNPLANTILGSGIPPIIEMLEKKIPVAISTDGSGSADNQNIINAARLASQYQKAFHKNPRLLPAQKVLEMITIEAAKILRVNAGSLEEGKDADLIVIDLDVPQMTPTRLDTVVENLIWAAVGNEVKYVIANGKILLNNFKYQTLDRNKIIKDIMDLADMFGTYMQNKKPVFETGARTGS